MNSPGDFLILLDLEICVDSLAREIAFFCDDERVRSLITDMLALIDVYGPDRLRAHAPSLLFEAGLLMLEVSSMRMKAGQDVLL